MAEEVSFSDMISAMLEKFEESASPELADDFDPAAPHVLLLVCKWYGKADELANMMISLYSASAELSGDAESVSVAQATMLRKIAIARAFRFWMDVYPDDFTRTSSLIQQLAVLQQAMAAAQDQELLDLVSSDGLPEDSHWFQRSLSIPSQQALRRPSLGFDVTTASDLAELMSYIDFQLFQKVPVNEFCVYARAAKPTEETPRIEECIQLFNGLTIWVVCNILRELTIVKRAVIIEKFVDCAKCLQELHCYNTLLALVGGLNHFSIRRLTQTWSKVDKGRRAVLESITQFFSSHLNYSMYRGAINAIHTEFHIPVLGILLKDLVAIDAQGKDYVSGQLLNMPKYRLLWSTMSLLNMAQAGRVGFTVDGDHMRILRVAISQTTMNDNSLEELSLAREPRYRGTSKETTARVDSLPKFSEWATGRKSGVDTGTLNKHVKQMVEAVFRAYDTDNSGSISTAEFGAISSNFPFIECFSVLDQDNDGLISYDELLSYFQSANSQLRERFTHLFVEHTFISTPVCEHCKGMMKGIVKQGVRCKDCGISCHKHCKDHVVVDCSKRKEKKKAKVRDRAASLATETSELYCDDDTSIKERLARAETARDALSAENSELLAKLAEANAKIHQLQSHIAVIRQHTIGFILEQMNTLSPAGLESGTEV